MTPQVKEQQQLSALESAPNTPLKLMIMKCLTQDLEMWKQTIPDLLYVLGLSHGSTTIRMTVYVSKTDLKRTDQVFVKCMIYNRQLPISQRTSHAPFDIQIEMDFCDDYKTIEESASAWFALLASGGQSEAQSFLCSLKQLECMLAWLSSSYTFGPSRIAALEANIMLADESANKFWKSRFVDLFFCIVSDQLIRIGQRHGDLKVNVLVPADTDIERYESSLINVQLKRRIQIDINDKRRNQFEAFLMATHPRLGEDSPLAQVPLCEDMISLIAKHCFRDFLFINE